MKTYFAAAALAAALVQPASATTFPTLTTIYVGPGVRDSGQTTAVGTATVVLCSNVSGVTTTIRFLFLSITGSIAGIHQANSVAHGATVSVATHDTTTFVESAVTGVGITQGVVNIESLQSGVFCTAAIVGAATEGEGIPLHLVRVNPHPGTVE